MSPKKENLWPMQKFISERAISFSRTNWGIVFILGILVIFYFYRIFLLGEVLLPLDMVRASFPWRAELPSSIQGNLPSVHNNLMGDAIWLFYPFHKYATESIHNGKLPLWDPHLFCGNPFLANPINGFFYPLNIIRNLTSGSTEIIGYLTALELFFAGFFMFIFLKRLECEKLGALIGAVTYMFSGFFSVWIESPWVLHVTVWIPLILLLYDKAIYGTATLFWTSLLGITIAFTLLGGHLQFAAYALFILCSYGIYQMFLSPKRGKTKKTMTVFLGALCFGLGLASVQLIPTMEFLTLSNRQLYTASQIIYIPFRNLITLIFPDLFGNPLHHNYWGGESSQGYNYAELAIYVGIFPLFLAFFAILARRDRPTIFFGFLAIIAMALALPTGLHRLIDFIPLIQGLAARNRISIIFMFSISILAALGAGAIARNDECSKKWLNLLWKLGGTIYFFALIVFVATIFSYRFSLFHIPNGIAEILSTYPSELVSPFVVCGAVIFFLRFSIAYGFGHRIIKTIALGLTVGDLFLFGINYPTTSRNEIVYPMTPSIRYLARDPSLFRVVGILGNALSPFGVQSLEGVTTLYIGRYGELINHINGSEKFGNAVTVSNFESRLLDMLNVKYIVVPQDKALPQKKYEKVFDSGVMIYKNLGVLPRSFIVRNIKVVTEPSQVLSKMISDEFDPAYTAIVEEPVEFFNYSDNKRGDSDVKIIRYEPEWIVLMADLTAPGLLVLADAYYPGWKVYVDGQLGRIVRVNYIFRGVMVDKGSHVIEFRYFPESFRIGVVVSALSIIAITFSLILSFSKILKK